MPLRVCNAIYLLKLIYIKREREIDKKALVKINERQHQIVNIQCVPLLYRIEPYHHQENVFKQRVFLFVQSINATE